MGKLIRLTAIQPPFPDESFRLSETLECAHQLVDQAGELGTDIALLPEMLNMIELGDIDVKSMATPEKVIPLVEQFSSQARKHSMYLIVPLGEVRPDGLFNTSIIIGRDGQTIGRYDKTHLAQAEHVFFPEMKAGNDLPTFDLDFGRIGIMTCYDGYFPEVAIIYSLKGAEVLFYPRWQSGPDEKFLETHMRARAQDHGLFLVSSSFGVQDDVPWKPGMLLGRSCVIGRNGTFLADAGHEAGIATAVVDLERPWLIECLDEFTGEGMIREYREIILKDRRPELYRLISSQD
jgi:predicted amidohydrolase